MWGAKTFAHRTSEIEALEQSFIVIDMNEFVSDMDADEDILPAQGRVNVELVLGVQSNPPALTDEADESDAALIER